MWAPKVMLPGRTRTEPGSPNTRQLFPHSLRLRGTLSSPSLLTQHPCDPQSNQPKPARETGSPTCLYAWHLWSISYFIVFGELISSEACLLC